MLMFSFAPAKRGANRSREVRSVFMVMVMGNGNGFGNGLLDRVGRNNGCSESKLWIL